MKALFTVIGVCAVSSMAFAAGRQTLLTCQSPLLEKPRYAIEVSDDDFAATYLVKYPAGGAAPASVEISGQSQVMGYGNTYIVTENLGRSGYAHLYADVGRGVALIDINMFLDRSLNTSGPELSYKCEVPTPR